MATPFHDRSPCQTASYPRARSAFTGNAPCSALSSWRLTTSGSAFASHASRLSSRLLMLLMLKVATFTKSLSAAHLLTSTETLPNESAFYTIHDTSPISAAFLTPCSLIGSLLEREKGPPVCPRDIPPLINSQA